MTVPIDFSDKSVKPQSLLCVCGRPGEVLWRGTQHRWQRHRQCFKGRKLRERYGITCADFDKMLADQGGLCKFSWCGRPADQVDHDHNTGRVRGILCWQHNVRGMQFLDEVVRKDALAELLEYAGLDKLGGGQLVLKK